jgi:hypothetical protein
MFNLRHFVLLTSILSFGISGTIFAEEVKEAAAPVQKAEVVKPATCAKKASAAKEQKANKENTEETMKAVKIAEEDASESD